MDNDSPEQEAKDAKNKIGESTIFGQRQLEADHSEGTNTESEEEIKNPEEYMRYLADRISRWWRKLEQHSNRTIATFTIVIALTGIVYTFFAGGQWDEMKTSNGLSQEALESVQRAFLTCRDVTERRLVMHDILGHHGIWTFTMPCENTGTTPANATAQAFFDNRLGKEPSEQEFTQKPYIYTGVIGPKALRYVGSIRMTELEIFGKELPDKTDDILKMTIQTTVDREPPVFWGWISYRDIFPKTNLHITEFCQKMLGITIDRTNLQSPFSFSYLPCEEHNCADENCKDYRQIVALAENIK